MNYSYTWSDSEQTLLIREDSKGAVVWIPTTTANRYYDEFLSSGATAAAYVAPPAPPEPTAEQKLANSGLTVDELKDLLGL